MLMQGSHTVYSPVLEFIESIQGSTLLTKRGGQRFTLIAV